MQTRWTLAAFVAVSLLSGPARAGPKTTWMEGCDACHASAGKYLAPSPHLARPAAPSPFIYRSNRYEPVLRDIRLVPAPTTLPGGDFGQRQVLPVLPAREGGFFLIPLHR